MSDLRREIRLRRKAATLLMLGGFALALCVISVGAGAAGSHHAAPMAAGPQTANPAPPSQTVKLIFVHHSTGGNWLADPNEDQPYGGLGRALMNNNYFVSATNYGWGPDGIGDRTDIPSWPEWFTGPNSGEVLSALYTESGQNVGDWGSWPRLSTDPGGENEIIMFKSCFPNSDLYGNPDDPPGSEPNDEFTVSNAKAVYNDILTYFDTRQDKLFIVITAPPLMENETAPERAANARAFDNWLVNDWLDGYPHNNVAVFDYYNVLTSNGGDVDTNDVGWATGNHHRWWSGAVQHQQTVDNNFSAYPSGDSHPSTAGHQKAASEFVQLLNVFYNRWRAGGVAPTASATLRVSPTATNTLPANTATPTPTGTPPAGQQTMIFQDGVSPSASYAGTTDVILANDAEPNANVGGVESLETFFGAGEEYRRSLMRWDISALPGDATISSATVELYRYDGGAENAMPIALYRVTRGWIEGSGHDFWPDSSYVPDGATWTSASPGTDWTTPGGDYDTTTDYGHGPNGTLDQITLPADMGNGWVTLDATAAVRAWVERGTPNYGLLLRPQSGDYTYHYYRSRNHNTPNLRPRLVINYAVGVVTMTPTATSVARTSTPTEMPTPTRTGGPPTARFVYQPLIMRSQPASVPTPTPTAVVPSRLVEASDLVYVGAFRLPGGDTPPQTFAYGGNAMTFNPDGDPSNTDPYPGSLFVMGHDRIAYGSLPDGNQVAEVSIPVPTIADNPVDLPQAAFIQGFHDVTAGYFTQLEEIPKVGMQYLNHPATGPKIHLAWGQHLQPQNEPSHAWFNPTLETPDLRGVWFIGHQNLYSTNGYMFDIPAAWADANAESRYLATGRMRDGGQGGMGPTLFAYRPWMTDGSSPPSGTHLNETTLLLYENAYNTDEIIRCLNGHQHPDEWEGGAWITTPSGKQAVLFAGTKSNGTKFWYGYVHPDGPQYPCVDAAVTDFVTCRMADGTACPPEDFAGCCDEEQGTCVSLRGWWSTRFDAQFILYDPADLARVAAGDLESWEPQPYASLDVDERLYLDPPVWDRVGVGWGDQRRYRIGPAAYDRNTGVLYVLELLANGAEPVVHVWRVAG